MSEPQRIGEILPEVMRDIEQRCNRYRRRHGLTPLGKENKSRADYKAGIVSAVNDFVLNKKKSKRRQFKRAGKAGSLFDVTSRKL